MRKTAFIKALWDQIRSRLATLECTLTEVNSVGLYSKKCWVVLTQIWFKYGQTQMLG